MKDLEEQLIALDLIFMIIKNLPSRRCRAMKNKIVNVPLDSKDVQDVDDDKLSTIEETFSLECQVLNKQYFI